MKRRLASIVAIAAMIGIIPSPSAAASKADRFLQFFFECRLSANGPGAPAKQRGAKSCAAAAAHQQGLAVEPEDPDEAARFFERAIAADPSFAPSYLALGRVLIDRGAGMAAAVAKIGELLARAPRTPELVRLAEKIAGWRRAAEADRRY